MTVLRIRIFSISMLIAIGCIRLFAGEVHFEQGKSPSSTGNISLWSDKPGVKIEHTRDDHGDPVSILSGGDDKHFLTPMINLKPITVSRNTVLEFRMKCPVGGIYKLNLTNGTENAWYHLRFTAAANEWVHFRQYIAGASPGRRLSKERIIQDGFLGDPLIRVQIDAKGDTVQIKDIKIYESGTVLPELPEVKPLARDGYQLREYPRYDREGLFPFGVISTVKPADIRTGEQFGQNGEERRELDALTCRRLNFNTYCNFMDESLDVAGRLKLMEKYDLYLIETASAYLDYLNAGDRLTSLVAEYGKSPRLICWYGRDEPQNLERYLDWKLMVNQHSPDIPFASALDNTYKIKLLAPLMEITMPDVYPLGTGNTDKAALDIITKTGAQINLSRQVGGRGKVWSINQAFSLRRHFDDNNWFLLRYPSPTEIRFDFFNSLTAGAEGVIYFILNDEAPFLDGKTRWEEFDKTLLDPWYNPNSTTEELARLGAEAVPAAAFVMGTEDIAPYQYSPENKTVNRISRNAYGRYHFVANADLNHSKTIDVALKLEPGEECVDLISGTRPDHGKYTLAPGYGAVFMVGAPDKIKDILDKITCRKLSAALTLAEIENHILCQAGQAPLGLDSAAIRNALERRDWETARRQLDEFSRTLSDVTNGNSQYAQAGQLLRQIRQSFGKLYDALVIPEQIEKYDGKANAAYEKLFDQIRCLSREYFTQLRQWRNTGKCDLEQLEKLRREVAALKLPATGMDVTQN